MKEFTIEYKKILYIKLKKKLFFYFLFLLLLLK